MKLAVLFVVLLGAGVAHAEGPVDPYEESSATTDPFGPRAQGRAQGARKVLRQALVRQFDRNGDGRLEPRERKQAAHALRRLANRLQHGKAQGNRPRGNGLRRQRLIQRFDLDGDGNLGPGELPSRVIERLRHLDRNGDGWLQNNEL